MKHKFIILSLFLVLALNLSGCSSEPTLKEVIDSEIETETQSEEALREKIRAEIEAEIAAENESADEQEPAIEENSTVSETNEGIAGELKIMINQLNVRDDASTNSAVIGAVNEGEMYKILDQTTDTNEYYKSWYKIQLDDNTFGWVAGWFCITYSDEGDMRNLESAYDGYFDGYEVGMGSTTKELLAAFGEPIKIKDSQGGALVSYENMYYFILNYGKGDDKEAVFTMGTSRTDLSDDGSMFGINIGMSPEEVTAILGRPNYVKEWEWNSSGSYWPIYDTYYIVGEYDFIVKYNPDNKTVKYFRMQDSRIFEEKSEEELKNMSNEG